MRRGQEAATKRARELARQDKRTTKKEKREARLEERSVLPAEEVDALMEEFARLAEKHATKQIDDDEYSRERLRLFQELGIDNES